MLPDNERISLMEMEVEEMAAEATDESSERNEDDDGYVPDRVMILFMGRGHEHALTSFQHYAPDAVHLITSDELRSGYVRRLNTWSKRYGFRKGTVQSVSDLFEASSIDSLLSRVFSVATHEFNHSGGRMLSHTWSIGITGGTMHMAAVATLASNILDASAFYVVRPKEGEAVMPNKQVIEMPTMVSLKTAMALNASDVKALMEEGTGEIPDLLENTGVEPWLLCRLEASGILETHHTRPVWRLTQTGGQLLTMLRTGPMFSLRLGDENSQQEEAEGGDYDGGFHG